MNRLRTLARWLLFVGMTGLATPPHLLVLLILALFPRARLRWQAFVLRVWSRAALVVIGVRTEVRGIPPGPPFFLVSNHLSYIDVAVLASHLDCVFVAKSEVARWPVIGFLCRLTGTLFIDRDSKRDIRPVLEQIERVLDRGVGVVVFPEGTSSDGRSVLPFKPALLEAPARARLPVSYASLTYRTTPGAAPAHTGVCWWGDAGFVAHLLGMFRIPRIYATLEFGADSIREADRKALASRLWLAVSSQFRPVDAAASVEEGGGG